MGSCITKKNLIENRSPCRRRPGIVRYTKGCRDTSYLNHKMNLMYNNEFTFMGLKDIWEDHIQIIPDT